jgi:pimeloyl-ACP methyl ester carboxylesterase
MTETKPLENLSVKYLSAPPHHGSDGERIAYKASAGTGSGPSFIWCGGLRSDMEGGKALHLHSWALQEGHGYIRFDYYGHGVSSGEFERGHIGRWSEDVIRVIDDLSKGDVILVGSSMGGWASLLAAIARPERVKALLLIAPAPDFTQKLMWPNFDAAIKHQIEQEGVYYEPSPYGEPMPISKVLIEESAKYQLLDAPIDFNGPVRILQGMKDDPVPWQHALKITQALTSEDVELTFVKNGDHRLSEPQDLARLTDPAAALIQACYKTAEA